ncbi:conserved hypothetical protein [Tenacibaculum maritimum]|uniref:restriction endonuclease subunit S n=1 Tax=Tenacibaculum maritimum TaxID=107401 RepID=UPI0012E5A1AA|nr:restriction endonuclease subunit S [Tenacibaculum maritimum]CAA0164333.1 conserved hypothetical protein [Tenacibaculum maritimum]
MELTKSDLKKSFYGLVPTDWITCQFQEVLTGFSSGMTPYRAIPEYYKGNIPWITSGELNYNVITDTIEKITQEAVVKTNLKILPKGTFLMAITGLEAAGTRGSCAITGVEATTNQSCMALFPKEGKIETNYLYHFYVMYGNDLAFKFCQGSKQQSYTGRIVKILPINLPPTLKEQKAIATALSDVDDLIASLEDLIAKKQAIKQGAMQQLLIPKEHWVKTCLVELAENKKSRFDDGDWIESEHIISQGVRLIQTGNIGIGSFLDKGNKKYISEESFNQLNCKEVLTGDLLVCRLAEPAGRACIMPNIGEQKVITSVDVSIFRGNESLVSREFLSQIFTTKSWFNKVLEKVGGTTHKRISRGALGKIEIELPQKKEQDKTAKILSDMDGELEQLETKKAKYQQLKQGMLQELLTGNTRLV